MAQPTGVYVTFSSAGLREDLENVIYDISPTDTPFMSMGGRMDAIAVNHQARRPKAARVSGQDGIPARRMSPTLCVHEA